MVLEAFNELTEIFNPDEELLDLKEEVALSIAKELEKKYPELSVVGAEIIAGYLISDGFWDTLKDNAIRKLLEPLLQLFPEIEKYRKLLKETNSKEDLDKLKNEILALQSPSEASAVSSTENPPTPDQGATPSADSSATSVSQSSSQISSRAGAGAAGLSGARVNVLSNESDSFPYESLKGFEKPDKDPFNFAIQGYEKLKGKLGNPKYLTVVDYSKSNKENRFFVINMQTKSVEYAVPVGHGKKSGGEFANSFSDKMGSNQSSLGFYRTPEHITKANTKSRSGLLLRGVEESNDNATNRGIYIHPGGVNGSEGCFTLPEQSSEIMNKLKGDSLLFAYYPDNQYLASSEVLHQNDGRTQYA